MGNAAEGRLKPTLKTVKELFAKSGNECAFLGCSKRLMSADGLFVARVCYIEGAQEADPRYRESMTDEERQHVSNLMLLCHEHHLTIKREDCYSVASLAKMNADHEARFLRAPAEIWETISIEPEFIGATYADGVQGLADACEWQLEPDEMIKRLLHLDGFATKLEKLPRSARKLLADIARQSADPESTGRPSAVFRDISAARENCSSDLVQDLEALQDIDIVERDLSPDSDESIVLRNIGGGQWNVWADIKRFCARKGARLDDILVELRFDRLQ